MSITSGVERTIEKVMAMFTAHMGLWDFAALLHDDNSQFSLHTLSCGVDISPPLYERWLISLSWKLQTRLNLILFFRSWRSTQAWNIHVLGAPGTSPMAVTLLRETTSIRQSCADKAHGTQRLHGLLCKATGAYNSSRMFLFFGWEFICSSSSHTLSAAPFSKHTCGAPGDYAPVMLHGNR